MSEALIGIDVGKTNLRVAVFGAAMTVLDRWSTSALEPTLAVEAMAVHLRQLTTRFQPVAAGVSVFGPLQTDPGDPSYGAIYRSSAPAWSGMNLPQRVHEVLGVPMFFDYDVNAGALAESRMGAGEGLNDFVYLSVGTGIGGVVYRSGLTPGYAPQMGHMAIPREPDDGSFAGSCRFHGGCFQGLASGLAVAERWGQPAERLPEHHPAWDLQARYLARACSNLVYLCQPERILLASSVALAPGLLPVANRYLRHFLNGFLEPSVEALYAERDVITLAALTPDSSLIGAGIMARDRWGLRPL